MLVVQTQRVRASSQQQPGSDPISDARIADSLRDMPLLARGDVDVYITGRARWASVSLRFLCLLGKR